MKSNIKKDTVLNYIISQFNNENSTQDIKFIMGSEGMPLYKPISFEGVNGTPDEFEFFDEQTYQISKEQAIPISIPVIEADYANLITIDETKRIGKAVWSVNLSFLVYANSYVHNKLLFAIEEFRDKMLGKMDIINTKQWDYSNPESEPSNRYYTVVVATGDIVPSDLLTINGDIFMEYGLSLDLDVSEGIDYGNQYEFYINEDRVLPLQTSLGVENSTKGNQLLNNSSGLSNQNPHIQNRYKMIHNLIDTKGFSINMSFMKTQEDSEIINELFSETFSVYNTMNRPYKIEMRYRPIVDNNGIKSFGTPIQKFNYNMILLNATTEFVHGDDIIFSLTFIPSWNEVV
jgi:hypothetical protein